MEKKLYTKLPSMNIEYWIEVPSNNAATLTVMQRFLNYTKMNGLKQ